MGPQARQGAKYNNFLSENEMENFFARMREPSTWRGLAMITAALGVSISPETMEYTIAAGTGLSGMIGIFTRDA